MIKRRYIIGWVLLFSLVLASAACDAYWCTIGNWVLNSRTEPFVFVMMGMIVAQPIALTIWLTLGHGSAIVRALICCALGLGFVSIWYLNLDLNYGNQAFFRQGYYFVFYLPVVLLAFSIPMLITRYFGLRQFVEFDQQTTAIDRLTVADIMILMFLSALAVTSARFGWDYADHYMPVIGRSFGARTELIGILIGCGVGYVSGIVFTLGCISLAKGSVLFDVGFTFASILSCAVAFVLICLVLARTVDFTLAIRVGVLALSTNVTFVLFLRSLRMVGYRLERFSPALQSIGNR